MNADYWINKLNLLPHPEGGHYRETYRCTETVETKNSTEPRNISTAIYFLLDNERKSYLHRIKSDELWFFHEGQTLEIVVLSDKGCYNILLGKDPEREEYLQAVIPAGAWFGARLKEKKGFALVSCTVAPGFDFRDFELARKDVLQKEFPEYKALIEEMALS